jgi:DNA-binding XRE family transcriptional regulator
MKKVSEHIADKLKKQTGFKARHELVLQKAQIAKIIIGYRIKHDLSQAQLAAIIGVSQQYISKIEEGRFSTLETVDLVLARIGYRLKLTVEQLSPSKNIHSVI